MGYDRGGYRYFQSLGLTNKDTESLDKIMGTTRKRLVAVCEGCRPLKKSAKVPVEGNAYKYKQVPRNTEMCPDCGYYLTWKWISSGQNQQKVGDDD